MNIGRGIYNLLKRQSEVYVKGLGSFRRQHTPAAYDEERQVYLPPINHIVFDGASEAGYDFVRYVQALQLIDRIEADRLVTEAVAELHRQIEDEGRAKLDDLGYLVAYGDSHVFKAFDLSGFNYRPMSVPVETASAMGELSVELEKAVVEEERAEREEREKREYAPAEAVMPAFVPETEEEERGKWRQSGTLWYVVSAVLILGIIAALAWYTLIYQKTTQPVTLVDAEPTETQSPETEPTEAQSLDTLEQRIVPADTASVHPDSLTATPTSGSAETPLVPEDHAWQIVIGSFRTMEEANSHAETYHKAGHTNVKVIPSKMAHNRKKVIWGSYPTKAEVDSALKHVQTNIIKDAWPDKL